MTNIKSFTTPASVAHDKGAGFPGVQNLKPGSLAPAYETDIKYTVVIPSCNRQRYAVEAVQTALLSDRDDVQVIVADASDDETILPRLLEEAGVLDRIVFLPAPDRALPMKENWERALDYAAGEWITYIGDDDGLLVEAFDALDFLTTAFKTHVITWRPAYYKWPDFPECDRGVLTLPFEEIGVNFVETMKVLNQHIDWTTADKWPHAGPSIYHGAVHRDVIGVTRMRYGRYFLNSIVDYSCAVTNCTFMDRFVQYRWPITVMGACGHSNTAGLTANGTGKKKVEQLRRENPDFKAVYPGFEDSRLMACWVIAGYQQLLTELGLPYNMTPSKFAKSMMNELGRVRDKDVFDTEHARLRAFMVENGLDTSKLDAMRCVPTMKVIGLNTKPMQLFADTIAFGWTGIYDVVTKLESLRPHFGRSVTGHGQLIERTRSVAPDALNENADDAYAILARIASSAMADYELTAMARPSISASANIEDDVEDAVTIKVDATTTEAQSDAVFEQAEAEADVSVNAA